MVVVQTPETRGLRCLVGGFVVQEVLVFAVKGHEVPRLEGQLTQGAVGLELSEGDLSPSWEQCARRSQYCAMSAPSPCWS